MYNHRAIFKAGKILKVQPLLLPGIKLITPQVYKDARGYFLETYEKERYGAASALKEAKQENLAYSHYGVIRGMHFQSEPGQEKLIQVLQGRIYDVFVNIDTSSPYFGKWQGIYLDAEEHLQLYIPVGYAHGYCCVSESALVLYKVSAPYNPKTEKGFLYNDEEVGIKWPIINPIVSERDHLAPRLRELELA